MLHLKGGTFVFDESVVRNDPITNFKDMWSGEISLARLYKHCGHVFSDQALKDIALYCEQLHEANAETLSAHIHALGGEAHHIDLWHSIVHVPDLVVDLLGSGLSERMFHKLECDRLSEYMDKLSTVENEDLAIFQDKILPNQDKCFEVWKARERQQT